MKPIKSGIVVRDDSCWQGHPDVAFFRNKFYVVYRESTNHRAERFTYIKLVSSDNGINFSEPRVILDSGLGGIYNCPRLSVIDNNLYMTCDYIKNGGEDQDFQERENDETNTLIKIVTSGDGISWSIIDTNIRGIVPDKLLKTASGSYIIGSHSAGVPNLKLPDVSRTLSQYVWLSDSANSGQWNRHTVASTARNLCEGSICEVFNDINSRNELICIMRENSGLGLPAFLSMSFDDGRNWSCPTLSRFFGCHRPTLGVLRSGSLLITYREQMFSRNRMGWARNTFCCLSDVSGGSFNFSNSVLLPLDHDSSYISDSGYTGWVQLPDDSIYIVNYITDDAPKSYIKWYKINESDFVGGIGI